MGVQTVIDPSSPATNNESVEVNEPILTVENGKPEEGGKGSDHKNEAENEGVVEMKNKPLSPEPPLEEASVRQPLADNNMIIVKVKDFFGVLGPTEAQTIILGTTSTFGDLFLEASLRFGLDLGDFDIIYQDKSFSYNLSGFPEDQTFDSLNIVPHRDKAYWMSLDVPQQKKGKRRSNPTEATPSSGEDQDSALASAFDLSSPFGGKRDFVGLKNRNMTCYLNSFLQGLWFTPEFRNALYNFVYVPGRFNRKSLCLPLQKLFLQQQFSIRDSIDTDELIKTFGWEDRETWNQHDIEELCSIFMENLTAEFKGTPMEGIIQALYFGTLDDYVKCLECGRVSQRTDDFLVIPLPIRNFGSMLLNPTLEAAFNSFVAYEELDGNNMYNCSQCEKPCPAHKGLKFNRLPYILSIQLKRFEYDFIKDRRLKLNDRVAFPFVLDMNPFIEKPSPERKESLKTDLLKPDSMKVEGGRNVHSRPSIALVDPEENEEASSTQEGAAGGTDKSICEQMLEMAKEKGPEIYQLYAVMVHRGGINSGHYYAYIMDFERGKWFRCDDAVVRRATIADIEGAYGGESDEDRELTSAYMLLYRRFDPELNILPYYLEEMPQHMQEMWKDIVPFDKQLHEDEELAKNTIRMTCLFKNPDANELLEKVVSIPKSMSMEDAAVFVYNEVYPNSESPNPESGCLRLCRYDRDLGMVENSFEGFEDKLLITALRQRGPLTKNEGLLLERKNVDEQFHVYRQDDLVFRTYLVDCRLQEILNVEELHIHPSSTVDDLIAQITRQFSLADTNVFLVAHYLNRFSTIVGDKHPLSLFKFDKLNNLYVQPCNEDGLMSLLLDFVEKYTKAEIIEIHIQVPPNFDLVNGNVDPIVSPVESAVELVNGPEGCPNGGNTKSEQTEKPQDVKEAAPAVIPTNESKPIEASSELSNIDQSLAKEELDSAAVTPATTTLGLKPTVPMNEYYIKFTNRLVLPADNVIVYTVRIDGQTPLYALSKRISEIIKVNENDFVLYKVDRNETTEMRRMTERIIIMKPFDRLFVKLEHRLQDGEARLGVSLLNVGCIDRPLEYLTEIVVTLKMTVDDVKTAILKKCDALQSDASVDKSRLRIRKKVRTNPSKIMRPNSKLQDIFTVTSLQGGEIYLQILDNPCDLTDKNYCLIYRLWHPSTGILDSTVEITIFHDHTDSLEEVILKKLRESLGIGEDVELEAAKPDIGYPWNIPVRLVQDLGWFSLTPPVKKSLYVYNDELCLFIRDKSEVAKDYDLTDLDAYRPQNMLKASSAVITESPRREQGLKLNLAKSPPQ